ncbi:hypothetical protein PIIN_02580 [Serendipita indica DSM 11827]|uniref:Uncharacterized protein n=1 Tax=Serendipita indica (strain DSM 11827) TaxID=1109443 RepID=G4TBL2_SERID|nr:hypothetical protein PIIN_02580 [Serendipita indica DSM 11827]
MAQVAEADWRGNLLSSSVPQGCFACLRIIVSRRRHSNSLRFFDAACRAQSRDGSCINCALNRRQHYVQMSVGDRSDSSYSRVVGSTLERARITAWTARYIVTKVNEPNSKFNMY